MSEKIRSTHLDRAAYVYVRQSTMQQVRTSRESQRRQYSLADRARDLGFREVRVIDTDLGRSGSGVQTRPGFAALLVAVCDSQAGAVLAIEASRLARNNREWHHLVDLCALTDTLVIDDDGIYDPQMINDRLLLGLKGTMSEFELSLFRQRAREAIRQMVERGEVITRVPVGYVRTEGNAHGCEKTPDRQVQEAIHGVFAKFRELGSARQVLLWYRREDVLLPTHRRLYAGELTWQRPTYAEVLKILTNPLYAGAYAHGRTRSATAVGAGGVVRKRRGQRVPMDQWPVLIRDHHEGYISWDEFLRTQQSLASNNAMSGLTAGAAKQGTALLGGLLRCQRCWRMLSVVYTGPARSPRYFCASPTKEGRDTSKCVCFGGRRVDDAVVQQVITAIRPLAVDASLDAHARLLAGIDEKRRALARMVEKARYEVDRARRQYDAVDPANRLVASELERRWNEALVTLHDAEGRLAATNVESQPPNEEERNRLLTLGGDLEALWEHPDASVVLKKRILRTVLTEIVADVTEDRREALLWLHWAGGVHTQLRVRLPHIGEHRYKTDQTAVDLISELVKVSDDKQIAAALNRLGFRTAKGYTWKASHVAAVRGFRAIPAFDRRSPRSWVTMTEASHELGISIKWIDRLLRRGILPGRQVIARTPWIIERVSLCLPDVQRAVENIRSRSKLPLTAPAQVTLPLKSTT
jgi:DNA invertase Pin-like site-specific DNA recombinase